MKRQNKLIIKLAITKIEVKAKSNPFPKNRFDKYIVAKSKSIEDKDF